MTPRPTRAAQKRARYCIVPDLPRALVAQPNRQPMQIMSVETIGDLAREASIDQLVTGLATFGPAYTRDGEPKSTVQGSTTAARVDRRDD
jgi:hypothetical protein